MIRRDVGDEFWLVTQDDHARLSAELGACLGNDRFAPPCSGESALLGMSMHDSGWPIHDDLPTLNPKGLPLDVFETPLELALKVWSEAPTRAVKEDLYAGLLVSLHVFWLSLIDKSAVLSSPERFLVNKFQHAQIELWEKLRPQLGLSIARPLTYGLDTESRDPAELALAFDLHWLQAMDRLSLFVCCTNAPFRAMEPIQARPGSQTQRIMLSRVSEKRIELDTWPFGVERIDLSVPFRRLPKQSWADLAEFRKQYHDKPVEFYRVSVHPRQH